MIISVNWLKKYLKGDYSIDELTERIGSRLVEIESTECLSEKYQDATVVKVVECVEHPNSDHLHICKIDDGGITKDIPRDDNGLIQVVCGAPNVHACMMAAWLPVGAVVPETYGTENELRLSARKLRGVISYGMLASPRELALWNEHEGIIELPANEVTAGEKLSEALELDDYLLEVENKSLTHRPDCFGMLGFAREVAAIFGEIADIPAWFDNGVSADDLGGNLKPTVTIADDHLCKRYECVALDNVDSSRQLPMLWRSYVARSGSNSISAPVDITNLLMYQTGQPLHAFDLDKLVELSPTGKPDIVVRAAKTGEKLELIDGRRIDLDPADIVVAVGALKNSIPVALAGAMGGMASEITPSTKRVLLESATFDLYHLRSTQFRHGIFSEAVTRFTKGQPTELTQPVLLRAVELMKQYAGATVIGPVVDAYPVKWQELELEIPVHRFTDVLGDYGDGGYTGALIANTLSNLGYRSITVSDGNVHAYIPWWRPDQRIDEDIIEDIGRVNGFDNIVDKLPMRPLKAAPYNELLKKENWLKDRLRLMGANEVVTYSFVHGDLLNAVHDDPKKAYRIINAISPRLQYCRRDLLSGLLPIARDNLRSGYDGFMLFEVGKVHRQGVMDKDEPLPAEIPEVSGILVDKTRHNGAAFYRLKHILGFALNIAPSELKLVRMDRYDGVLDSATNIFEPLRSAAVFIGGKYAGVIGEPKADVLAKFKLPAYTAGFSLHIEVTANYLDSAADYQPVSRYQGTSRDITYQVAADADYIKLYEFTDKFLAGKIKDEAKTYRLSPVDIYRVNENVKNVTLHIDFGDMNGTVSSNNVNRAMTKLAEAAEKQLDVKVI